MGEGGHRVLLCEKALGYQMLARAVLEDEGFAIAAVAESWAEATELATAAPPDVVLVDLWLPNFDRAALATLRDAASGAVLAVTSALGVDEVTTMLDGVAGVDLVLSKRDPPIRIPAALRGCLDARGEAG